VPPKPDESRVKHVFRIGVAGNPLASEQDQSRGLLAEPSRLVIELRQIISSTYIDTADHRIGCVGQKDFEGTRGSDKEVLNPPNFILQARPFAMRKLYAGLLLPHDRHHHGPLSRADVTLQVDGLLPSPQHWLTEAHAEADYRRVQ
jgi:hypothetical protein